MSLLPAVMPERVVALTVAIGWALVWFLGQGLLIGLLAAALLRALRRRSADLRYGIACTGLLMMVLCPVGTTLRFLAAGRSQAGTAMVSARSVAVRTPDRDTPRAAVAVKGHGLPGAPGTAIGRPSSGGGLDAVSSGPVPATTQDPRWLERVETCLPAVVAAWLIGVSVMALRLARGLIDVRGLIRRDLLSPTEELQALIGRLMEHSGLRRPVSWFLSLRVEVPTVVGWLRPTVLIPARGMARLTLRQLEALLAHEIAHIRRHDYLVNVCQVTVEAVLFFHPAVWWVSRRIRVERENCCDDSAVALCGGDRLLVARALFTLEEQRGAPALRVAAAGGSLKERVRRLVSPVSTSPCPAEAGWAGGGLIAGVFGLIAAAWLAGPTQARDEVAPKPAQSTVRGRVIDDAGRPVAGARVRLYRRDGLSDRHRPVVEEATAGPDGGFRLSTPLTYRPMSESRGLPPYVLLADRPGKAVGWRTIPLNAPTFEGDITLTSPTERTITVVDADGHPVQGAKVVAYSVGDSASPSPEFRDYLELFLPEDGPLTAITGAEGRATLAQLPKTTAKFVATKAGFAETYAFREQGVIRLTPAATLSGTVTGPGGEPLAGVKVVLYTAFMSHFERAVTDAEGRYRFHDLMARGWDMSAWTPNQEADGKYSIWLDDDRFVMHTGSLTLEPNTNQTLDIKAMKAGVIRVTLVEERTNKPVAGARIWGFDTESGSARFNAYTDGQGRATFYSAPAKISLGLAGPPDGVYIEGDLSNNPDVHKTIDFAGGEDEVTLVMPPIAGTLITVSGVCTLPDGSPAGDATVHAGAGRFVGGGSMGLTRNRRVDGAGRFTLEGVPSGQSLRLYAETADRKFAGTTTIAAPEKGDPAPRIAVPLRPTVALEIVIEDDGGKLLSSRKFHLSPKVGEEGFPFLRRIVESDAQGRVKFVGIVPGLSYRVEEDVPPQKGPIIVGPGGRLPWFDEVLVLAPEEER